MKKNESKKWAMKTSSPKMISVLLCHIILLKKLDDVFVYYYSGKSNVKKSTTIPVPRNDSKYSFEGKSVDTHWPNNVRLRLLRKLPERVPNGSKQVWSRYMLPGEDILAAKFETRNIRYNYYKKRRISFN